MTVMSSWSIFFFFGIVAATQVNEGVEETRRPTDYIHKVFEDDFVETKKKSGQSEKKSYNGYQLLAVQPTSNAEAAALNILRQADLGERDDQLEFWNRGSFNGSIHGDAVHVMVGDKIIKSVKRFLDANRIQHRVVIHDLQNAIDEENVEEQPHKQWGSLGSSYPSGTTEGSGRCVSASGISWTRYHRMDVIDRYVDCIARQYSDKVEVMDIGRSVEGRRLRVVKIGTRRPGKPAIWIDGGIHAREWISPASVTFTINQFITGGNARILNEYDIYVLPVHNPDGYEHSHTTERMWRRNRRPPTNDGECYGIDLNRNYGFEWGGAGSSGYSCHQTYRGPRPFSEPESAAVRDFILARRGIWKAFFTVHSYGQVWLYPFGYSNSAPSPPGLPGLERLGWLGAEAMRRVSSRQYQVGNSAGLLYPAAGTSEDWAVGSGAFKYAWTIELPDRGDYGFILPASKIWNIARSLYAGIRTVVEELIRTGE